MRQNGDVTPPRSSTTEKPAPLAYSEEVAEYLRVPMPTFYKWSSEGKGPPSFKPGKRLLFRWADVYEWLDKHPKLDKRTP